MESWVINLVPESRYEHIYFENGMLGLWKLRLLLLLLCLARGGRAEKNPNNKSQTFTTSFPSLVLWVMADELEKVKKKHTFWWLWSLVSHQKCSNDSSLRVMTRDSSSALDIRDITICHSKMGRKMSSCSLTTFFTAPEIPPLSITAEDDIATGSLLNTPQGPTRPIRP